MKRTLKIVTLKSNDVMEAWIRLVKYCLQNEAPIVFGDENDPKRIGAEICSRVVLEKNAVEQLINGVALGDDPRCPFGKNAIQAYINEYTLEYIEEQSKLPIGDNKKFTYTYYDRLRRYPVGNEMIDQIAALRDNVGRQVKSGIFSNRHQAITWIPEIDIMSSEPPCLQRIWVSLVDIQAIEVHLDWRSRDLHDAWLANLIAIVSMLHRDIAKPNNCEIVRVVDSCDSLHIYAGQLEKAKTGIKGY